MNMKALLLASAVTVFGASASADLVIDLAGQTADGEAFNVFTVNNANTAEVTGIEFDFVYDAGNNGSNISWGSEVVLEIGHIPTMSFAQIGTFDGGCSDFGVDCEFDLMWTDESGIFTGSGSLNFNPGVLDGSGDYQILIGDSFDDAGIDGVFLAGSQITILQDVAQVPVPATLLLVGAGLLGMGASRRRA